MRTLYLWSVVVAAQYAFHVQYGIYRNYGNYFVSFTNSLIAAERCPVTCTVDQAAHPPVPFDALPSRLAGNDTANLRNVTGSFYYTRDLRHFVNGTEPTWEERVRAFCPFVDSVYANMSATPLSRSVDDDATLVAHVRSGDIFSGDVHHDYWQPPLAFYQFAARNFSRIVICTLSGNNPVTGALHRYCKETRGAENCVLRVGGAIREDLSMLLSARNLAVGYGTFGITVYAMSRNVRRLFFPHTLDKMATLESRSIGGCRTTNVTRVRVAYNSSAVTGDEPWRGHGTQARALLVNETVLPVTFSIVE